MAIVSYVLGQFAMNCDKMVRNAIGCYEWPNVGMNGFSFG